MVSTLKFHRALKYYLSLLVIKGELFWNAGGKTYTSQPPEKKDCKRLSYFLIFL